LPAGAARNAIDCALWDLQAKQEGRPAYLRLGNSAPPRPLETAYTLSLGTPQDMGAQARKHSQRPLLKIKVGGDGDAERLRAVVDGAPKSRIIVDANEGWNEANIEENLQLAAELNIALVEQPLPAGKDGMLRHIPHPVPICADE